VAAINLAVDCIAPRKGLPKALLAIEPQFRYLVEQQKKHGLIIFFNITICRTNVKDVRMLTEIARLNGIGTDYHLVEEPQATVTVDHYQHRDNELQITPDLYSAIDELLDWLIEKHRQGWCMVNSPEHLRALKDRMRGRIPAWDCRAGHNAALIRPDGSLAPCFDLISHDTDWGRIWEPHFDEKALRAIKEECAPYCTSTCFYNLSSYYDPRTMPRWLLKHAMMG
jgi:MoaA/NifB/PqqE/SkfB family radical SAM enzyme